MIYSRRITKSLLALSLTMAIANITTAEVAKKNVNLNVETNKIHGYYPFMKSVSAELLTDGLNEENKPVSFPWAVKDDNKTRGPTIGSIVYVPDIFCSILPSEREAALADPILGSMNQSFDFSDLDKDVCNTDVGTGMTVKWYMLDDVQPWNDNLKWEDLNPVEIDKSYLIEASPANAMKYQKKHSYGPLIDKNVTLNILDAVEIPTAALGKRIGFILEPKSQYGLPSVGKKIKVWDLGKHFGQNPPNAPGEIGDDPNTNVGFILGGNPELNPDGTYSTAGGVVQLGRPPYIRSIGAQFDATVTNFEDPSGNAALRKSAFGIANYGATSQDTPANTTWMTGDIPIGFLDWGGSYVYIPDAFCEYKNNDYATSEQLNALGNLLKFPVFVLGGSINKFEFFRPLFWIADADEDSCDITSNQIEWFLVEPKSAKVSELKQKLQDYKVKYNKEPGATIDASPEEIADSRAIAKLSSEIWFEVDSWDDIVEVQKLENISPKDVINETVLSGTRQKTVQVKFSNVGNQYVSATKIPLDEKNRYIRQVGFKFTPKTKSGNPDLGRQIKVPVAVSRIWGQMPSNRPPNLAASQPGSDFMIEQEKNSTIRIGIYPQTIDRNSLEREADTLPEDYLKGMNYINYQCLFDLSKIPAKDCVSEMPPVRNFYDVPINVPSLPSVKSLKRNARGINPASTIPVNLGQITGLDVKGFLGKGEILEVSYIFKSTVITDIRENINNTVYAVGPIDDMTDLLDNSTSFAGENRVQGFNTFTLPPLTDNDIGVMYGIGLRPYNGVYKFYQDVAYNFDDLKVRTPPQVENVKIAYTSEQVLPGTILKGTYTFIKAVNEAPGEDASKYTWDGAARVDDRTIVISGEVDDYIVQPEDAGKTITLTVNAFDTKDQAGNSDTDSVDVASPIPSVKNLVITSSNEVFVPGYSATLTANYDFDSGIAGNNQDLSTFTYSIDNNVVATNSLTYQLTGNDLGKTIIFKITPINSLNGKGEVETASYIIEATPPSIENLKIEVVSQNQSPYSGTLRANYDFVPGITRDATDKSTFSWTGNSLPAQTRQITFNADDAGRTVILKATPEDGMKQVGEPKFASFDFIKPPQITDLKITETVVSLLPPYNVKLTASYTYVKGTSDKPNDNSKFEWTGVSNPSSGNIVNNNRPVLNVLLQDAGKLVTLKMTPKDEAGFEGDVKTATYVPQKDIKPPMIENLVIVNTNSERGDLFYIGDTIKAQYDFIGSSVNNQDRSTFIWSSPIATNSGRKVDGIDITYQIKPEEAGTIINLDMTAFDGLNNVGNNANAFISDIVKPPAVENVKIVAVSTSNYPWNVRVYGEYKYVEGISQSPANDSTYSWTGITNPVLNQPTRGSGVVKLSNLSINQLDAGKVLTLTVNARDFAGIKGNSESTSFNIPKKALIAPTIDITSIRNTNNARGDVILADDTLTADYIFTPGSESTVDASSFNWIGFNNTQSGRIGQNTLTYKVLASDVGQMITLEMQAIDGAGVEGNVDIETTVQSVSAPPQVKSVSIVFDPAQSTTITGTYQLTPSQSSDNTDSSYYRWVVDGVANAYTPTSNPGFVNGLQAFKVDETSAGKTIQLEILPRDKSGLQGTALKSNSLVYKRLNIDSLAIIGNAEEAQTLTAGATFTFGNNKTNNTTATWLREGAVQITKPITEGYLLTSDDVGKTITLSATAKDGNGILGNTLTAVNAKGPVTAAYKPPFVDDVRIYYFQSRDLLLPGNYLGGTYNVFDSGSVAGDKSLYAWLVGTEVKASGPLPAPKNVPSYTITESDVGQVITLRITARNGNSQTGNSAEDKTIKVSGSPMVSNPVITQNGTAVTTIYSNALLSGTYTFTSRRAGANDASIVTWYVDNLPKQTSKISTSGIAPSFQMINDYVGQIIKLEVQAADTLATPGGNTVSVSSTSGVKSSAPSVSNVLVNANFVQNASVTGTYSFAAGVGSNNNTDVSTYEWLVENTIAKQGQVTNGNGTITGANSYTVVTQDTGKVIRLRITPKDGAGQAGLPVVSSNSVTYIAPKVQNINGATTNTGKTGDPIGITYDFVQGSNPVNNSTLLWTIKSTSNVVKTATTATFTPLNTDVGSVVSVTVQAQDGNQILGNSLTKEIINPVVSSYIPPKVENVAIYYFSSRDLVMANQYLGGSYKFTDGSVLGDKSTYQWLSSTTVRKEGNTEPGRSIPAYYITDIDNGTVITLKVTARDGNGTAGNTAQDQTGIVVAPPKVSTPVITLNGAPVSQVVTNNQLSGTYQFTTGRPNATDASITTWYVNSVQKQQSKIVTSGIATPFNITSDYVGQLVKMEITAADSLATPGGNTISATTSSPVVSTAPTIESVLISADFQTSAVITGTYVYKAGASSNTLDGSRYEWLANDSIVKSGTLPGTNKVDGVNSYTVVTADTGKTLRLRLIPIDKSGSQGTEVYSSNSLVYNAPSVKINKVVGSGESNTAVSLDYAYTGGSNSTNTSTVQWTLSAGQTNSYVTGSSFTPKDADVGKTISVSVTAKDGNQITGNTDSRQNVLTVSENWPTANFILIKTASSEVVPTAQWVEYDYINPNVPGNEPDTTLDYRVDYVDPNTGAVVRSTVYPVDISRHDNAVQGSWQGGRDWYYGYEKYTVCVYVKTTDKRMQVIQKGKKCFAPPHTYGYRRD